MSEAMPRLETFSQGIFCQRLGLRQQQVIEFTMTGGEFVSHPYELFRSLDSETLESAVAIF